MRNKFFILIVCIILTSPFVTRAESVDKEKVAYLTFDADMTPYMRKKLDDGKVSSWYSKDLVTYLENEKMPATIFITGMFAELYPDVVKELAKYPTIEIANHTYDHSGFEKPCYGLKILHKDKEKIMEIEKTQKILTSLTGYMPTYFRYPGLCHNTHDDVLVKKLGLSISTDGLTSGDAFNTNSKNITNTVVNNIHDGSVVIMHLGGPNAPAIDSSIRDIVTKLRSEKYTFKTL